MEENLNNENEIVLDEDEVIEVNQENGEQAEENSEDVKTYTEEEVEQIKDKKQKEYDNNSQKIFDRRWAREKEKLEKANAPLYQIEDVLKSQLGATTREDLMQKLGDFYNVDMSSKSTGKLTERQERILAQADAEDIESLGYDEMVAEANRIYNIPKSQRTIHDSVVFESLMKEITEQQNKKELNEKGYDLAILEDAKFKDFKSKLNYSTPITEAVDLYNLMTKGQTVEEKPTKPASAGSTKSNVTQAQLKDFYSYEEAMRFSKADFDKNPELYKRVQASMARW